MRTRLLLALLALGCGAKTGLPIPETEDATDAEVLPDLPLVDLGSDLRPEDFLNPGVTIGAQLSRELLLNLFAADTPLHDGAVLVRGNRIESAGVILPLSRHSYSRYQAL